MKEEKIIRHPGLEVKRSNTHGYGVFTRLDIAEGEIIEECVVPMDTIQYEFMYLGNRVIQYGAEIMQNYRFSPPYDSSGRADNRTYFLMPLGNAGIYNHADEPNIAWEHDVDNRLIVFKAIKDIKAGEELCHYYGSTVTSQQLKNKNEYEANNSDMDKGIFVSDDSEE
jgi:SET domain-containing protein|tara:strand:+ start:173 stop:676 length:504 start_codon:yes stop_codon:yes gene_type:complete